MQSSHHSAKPLMGRLTLTAALTAIFCAPLFASPNNGYTTAANVYSGSASRSWFGGGTAYAIAQWKSEREASSIIQPQNEPSVTEQSTTNSAESVGPSVSH